MSKMKEFFADELQTVEMTDESFEEFKKIEGKIKDLDEQILTIGESLKEGGSAEAMAWAVKYLLKLKNKRDKLLKSVK